MSENEIQGRKFLNWINNNYEDQKRKLIAFCNDKKYDWDNDIFQDCIIKIYNRILKKKLVDDSDKGFEGYFFITFKINTMRNKQYAAVAKRDHNIVNLSGAYELYLNSKLTQEEKLISDLKKDYFTLYLMNVVERKFDSEHYYLFRLKTFDKSMTYSKLAEYTGMKGVRQKVVTVKNYLKQNVSKEEIEKAFEEEYGEFYN